jgi:pilus assembly protein CpaF
LHQGDRLPNTVALYSRPPSTEGEGEQTVSDLIRRATRRLNPTRVIVGEILGDEVGPVLDVFSGSTRGSGCTIHARSARGALRRFEQYGLATWTLKLTARALDALGIVSRLVTVVSAAT